MGRQSSDEEEGDTKDEKGRNRKGEGMRDEAKKEGETEK